MKLLRYTGAAPTTFMSVGEKESGAEFPVPDDEAPAYLVRQDIEQVPEPDPEPEPPTRPRKSAKAADDAAPDTTTAAE